MSQGGRPGGLTALAVLNFVWGGLQALFLLLAFAGLAMLQAGTDLANSQGQTVVLPPVMTLVYLALLLWTVEVILLITSGVGYLQQKKFLGKTLGSIYGLVAIGEVILKFLGYHQFGIWSIISLVYPVLTLALLNTVFKDDFPNP
jgi:hypothetical protein